MSRFEPWFEPIMVLNNASAALRGNSHPPKRHLRELPSIRAVVISLWLATTVETAGLTPIHLGAPRALDGVRPFLDSYGRERLFHGTNAVVKGPPWVPMTAVYDEDLSMVAKDFEALMAQGVNALRLGVMWSGVEPSQGKYNESYLDEVDKIVQTAAAHGVYTLLDMHQDGTPRARWYSQRSTAHSVSSGMLNTMVVCCQDSPSTSVGRAYRHGPSAKRPISTTARSTTERSLRLTTL